MKKILLIATGGTIASKYTKEGLSPQISAEELLEYIPTARGSIVDESALYEALKTRRIAGAALDVYEHEPVDMNHPLFELDNFIGTPHTSAETYENYENCGIETAQAIVDVLIKGETPENLL